MDMESTNKHYEEMGGFNTNFVGSLKTWNGIHLVTISYCVSIYTVPKNRPFLTTVSTNSIRIL